MPIKATHKPRIGSIAGEVIDTGTGCRRDTPQQRALPAGKGQRMILQPNLVAAPRSGQRSVRRSEATGKRGQAPAGCWRWSTVPTARISRGPAGPLPMIDNRLGFARPVTSARPTS
jgi:hypothetical protein